MCPIYTLKKENNTNVHKEDTKIVNVLYFSIVVPFDNL